MKVRVLGCSGGIGGPAATTAFQVDDDILIDAGTGVGALTLEEMAGIDHVFLTHSHLDHIACLPLMADSVGSSRESAVNVYGRPETIAILRNHIMNGAVWPDFTVIPTTDKPFLRLHEVTPGEQVTLAGRTIRSVEVNHTIPAVGYIIGSGSGSLAFSGDTTVNDGFWQTLNAVDDLRYLLVETTFADENRELAVISKHLCPSMLAGELKKLTTTPEIFISHLMPGSEQEIMDQIASHLPEGTPKALTRDQVFVL